MLKERLFNLFLRFGLNLSRRTASTDIRALISALRVQPIDIPLIRVGANHDGGYLLPDDLKDIEACFSPGVGPHSHFEKALASRNMEIFMADYSVDGPSVHEEKFHFTKKFIGAINDHTQMTLESWVASTPFAASDNLVLQMDIEGSEYEVLYQTPEALLKQFRIIVIEFHHMHMLFCNPMFQVMKHAFLKLLQTHECIHIHPNNCCYSATYKEIVIPTAMEFTFIRKGRANRQAGKPLQFPHPLDADTMPHRHIALAPCWYAS